MNRFVALALVLLCAAPAHAQVATRNRVPPGEVTGLEMGIDGSLVAVPGGRVRWFVTVYEVVRRRDLRPSPNTELIVTSSVSRGAPIATVRTDARGRAALDMVLPDELERTPTLRVEARSPRDVRRVFAVALQRRSRHTIELYVDRARVRPSGSVWMFGRVRDRASGQPVADAEVTLSHADEPVRTDAQGVFFGRASAPAGGRFNVSARTEHGSAATDVTVHEPSAPPLWVQAQPARSVAAPGERVPVDVVVRTSAGAPVQGALVRWTSESEDPETERRTDAAGRVRLEWLLARSTSEPVQTLSRRFSVVSPRRGTVEHTASLRVARVAARFEWAVEGGALVPGLPGRVYLRAVRPDGEPLANESITLDAGRLGGTLAATTDPDGVAHFDAPVAASGGAGECGGGTALTAHVVYQGHRDRLCLPVDPDASLTVRTRVVDDVLRAEIQRAPIAARAPVELATLVMGETGWTPIAVQVLDANETAATLALPDGTRGEVWVRARPILSRGGTARGGGALSWLPSPVGAPDLSVGPEGARVDDAPGTALIFATAAHGAGSLRQALAGTLGAVGVAIDEGRSPDAIAALLASRTPFDDAASVAWREGDLVPQPLPEDPVSQGLLRDPWRTRARFVRGRIGRLMRAVEDYVAEAIPDAIENVAVREGRGWRFNQSVIEAAIGRAGLVDETSAALDGEPLDAAALTGMDPSFTYDRVARRITRERLFRVNVMLRDLVRERQLDVPWARRGEPEELLPSMLVAGENGIWFTNRTVERSGFFDAWGQPFELRRVRGRARFSFLQPVDGYELASAGPDGRFGTGDDVVDPFARVLPSGGIYAEAVGEDVLLARLSGVALGRATLASLAEVFQMEPPPPWDEAQTAHGTTWGSLPGPITPPVDDAPVTPIRDALGGLGPEVSWELPPERRAYEVTAVRFRGASLRTARDDFVAGAPWVARVELPVALHVGEQLRVPITLVRLADAPRPDVTVEVSGRAVEASVDGETLRLVAARAGLADVRVRVRMPDRESVFEERLRVVPDGSLRTRIAATWTPGEAQLAIETPSEATPWRARLTLASPQGWLRGAAMDDARRQHPAQVAWAHAMRGEDVPPTLSRLISPDDPLAAACALVAWASDPRQAGRVEERATQLAEMLDDDLAERAAVLAALAPSAGGGPEGRGPTDRLIAGLRQDGWRTIARASDQPAIMARMAAGLLLANRQDSAGQLLLERTRERLTEDAHGRRWVPGRDGVVGDAWIATAALAIAARQSGEDALAEELAASVVARLEALSELGGRGLFWALASGVYGVFGVDGPERVRVSVDGDGQDVVLEDGWAELPLPSSANVTLSSEAAVIARAEARYLVPLEAREGARLAARLEGTAGRAGRRSGFELIVENATDEDSSAPIVAVHLPGAARCEAGCRSAIEASTDVRRVEPPDLAGVMRVHLAPVAAHSERSAALAFDWIASGTTRGLALMVWEADRPSAPAVTQGRTLTIEEAR